MNDKEKAFWVKEPDLVEVVRCKDCKHYYYYDYCGGYHVCGIFFNGHDSAYETKAEDFCSYGERKDND